MKKLFLIGLKDVKLAFRDRAALILMLLAPFLLTLGLGFVTGRFSGGSSNGISHIPVVLVNQDGKQLGTALVDLFQSRDLSELVAPTLSNDPSAARKLVDENQAVALVVIPAGFTDSIIPAAGQSLAERRSDRTLYQSDHAHQRRRDQNHPGPVHQPGGGRARWRTGGGYPTSLQRPHPGSECPGSWDGNGHQPGQHFQPEHIHHAEEHYSQW